MKITCPLKKLKEPTTRLFESRAGTNFQGVCLTFLSGVGGGEWLLHLHIKRCQCESGEQSTSLKHLWRKLVIIKVTECGRQRSKAKTRLLRRCAFRKFQVTDSQNTRDHITSDRRSRRAWSNCVLRIPFILSESPKERWLHACNACAITTWRLGLRAPFLARNKRWVYGLLLLSRLLPGFYSGHMDRADSLTSYALQYQWTWRPRNTLQGIWVRVPIQLLYNISKYMSFFTSKHEILDLGLRLDARKLVFQSLTFMYTSPNFLQEFQMMTEIR